MTDENKILQYDGIWDYRETSEEIAIELFKLTVWNNMKGKIFKVHLEEITHE